MLDSPPASGLELSSTNGIQPAVMAEQPVVLAAERASSVETRSMSSSSDVQVQLAGLERMVLLARVKLTQAVGQCARWQRIPQE